MKLVLWDDREGSSTRGLVSKVVLSEFRRRLINIPIGICHAVRNIGSKDVVAINFPTACYEHEDPDKYRLPVDTDKIPHKFENPRGGGAGARGCGFGGFAQAGKNCVAAGGWVEVVDHGEQLDSAAGGKVIVAGLGGW